MDSGQVVYILSRLILGALASFFAIMLWSKTRDVAWMLMVIGTIAAYVETVYSILNLFGISEGSIFVIGSLPFMSILLPCLPTVFFISAFAVMVVRKYRRR
jgi:biotin transporter BioY